MLHIALDIYPRIQIKPVLSKCLKPYLIAIPSIGGNAATNLDHNESSFELWQLLDAAL
jgi:hypothetical protein